MKIHRGLAASAATLLVIAGLAPVFAAAAEVRAGDQPNIAASESIKGNAYIAGGSVVSSGAIGGDLVAAGGNILINSPVSADLLAAGGSVTVLGAVAGDLRVAGGNIIINGKVGNDVTIGAGQTTISGGSVGGDVLWGGGQLTLDAPVAGDLKLGGGDVTINSTVRGNVDFKGGTLTFGKNAVINGDLTYESPKEATFEDGAVVKGKTTYTPLKEPASGPLNVAGLAFAAAFGKFLAVLACALVVGLIFKAFSAALVAMATEDTLSQLIRGAIVLIVLPVASVILLITVIGIPLGLLGLVSFVGTLVFGSIVAPIVLGSYAAKLFFKTDGYIVSWKTILLGVLLYTILGFVPFIGWLAKLAVFVITVGAMMKIKGDILKGWR